MRLSPPAGRARRVNGCYLADYYAISLNAPGALAAKPRAGRADAV
jgi:hypothetical protein